MKKRKQAKIWKTLILVSLLSAPSLQAQEGIDLRERETFFESQQAVYQEWLDQTGMGKVLKVEALGVKDTQVDLYLSLPNPNVIQKGEDRAGYFFANYRNIRQQFNRQNSLSLEQQLFLKMLHIMELEPSQATVQLYDTYDVTEDVLGFYGVYYEEDEIKVDSSGYMGTRHGVAVYVHLDEAAECDLQLPKKHKPQQVFACIKHFFTERVRQQTNQASCQDYAKKVIAFPISENSFQVSLKPVCKEVLKNQNNPVICDWLQRLGFNCNTIKSEWLTYTFTISPEASGYQLDCYIDGKCKAPEVFGGTQYKEIDHDTSSTKILQQYGDELLMALRAHLAMGC